MKWYGAFHAALVGIAFAMVLLVGIFTIAVGVKTGLDFLLAKHSRPCASTALPPVSVHSLGQG
jgi:hypothetical protein